MLARQKLLWSPSRISPNGSDRKVQDRRRLARALRPLACSPPSHQWYTLHPTPYTLHSTLFTLYPTSYTPHPTPYILHPTPFTLHPV